MAKNNSEKSKAELYREERKERIAKANKKNAKSIAAGKKAADAGKKIIAIILAVAIIGGVGYKVVEMTGIVEKVATAVKIGDDKVSATQYSYYYNTMYQQTAYYAQYYEQYGMSMGFDSSLAPDEQTTQDDEGNEITWAEYFEDAATERAKFVNAYYNEAVKAGFELSEEKKTELDETIENYRTNATEGGYSLNAYLKASFSNGLTEKVFRDLIEKDEMASEYYTELQNKYAEDVTDEDIEAEYKENSKNYDYADIRYYTFTAETLTAEEGESDEDLAKRQETANKENAATAKEVYAKVADLVTFESAVADFEDSKKADDKAEETADTAETTDDTAEETEEDKRTTELKKGTYSSISSAMNDKAADWVYAKSTKVGDKKFIENEANCYIIIVTKTAYTSHSVDVRHCLVSFNAEDSENVTDEEKATAKSKAEELLKEWKAGDATEETFAEMATSNSDDTGSTENGGLYEGMRITDSYVEPFLNWSFDSSRKVGDTGIVETEYGYHIMYFAADNKDDLDWKATIRTNKGTEAFEAFDEGLLADDGDYAAVPSEFWCSRISKQFCDKIKKNNAYSASQS